MTAPENVNDPSDVLVDRLVDDCLAEADQFAERIFDEACAAHADDADSIREQYVALRNAGLVGRVSSRPDEPDPWEAEWREGLPAQAATPPLETIGPYAVLKELGRGGQAIVYLAEDRRLGRPVALKVLKGLGPLSETMMRRFRREARLTSMLDHRGICSVFDAGIRDGVACIAMRFVPGRTLAWHIANARRRPAKPEDASMSLGSTDKREIERILAIVEGVARALHVAHEAGVIHRDVKPGNIMVTPNGEPVILDFGLAGDEDGGLVTLTETGDVLGSPAYMSPEQLAARRIRIDRRSDVYSLGVTLFECLTLERPYRARTREAMYRAIQADHPTDVRRLNPAVNADVRVIIETALEKDRNRRYRTAEELAEDLARAREGRPIRARPVSRAGRLWRWAKRHPARAMLALVLLTGGPVIGTLVGYLVATHPAVLAARQADRSAAIERRLETAYDALARGDAERAIAAFDSARGLKPDCVEGIAGHALALHDVGKGADSLALLDRHSTAGPGGPALKRFRRRMQHLVVGEEAEAPPHPRTALDYFLAGQVGLRAGRARNDPSALREALRNLERAVITAHDARAFYHQAVALAAGHVRDRVAGKRAADALLALWPDSERARYWAAFATNDSR